MLPVVDASEFFLFDKLAVPSAALLLEAPRPTIKEQASSYTITCFAPGVKRSDIAITLDGGQPTLRVKGHTVAQDEAHTHVVDWSVSLPRDVDIDQATASHRDGIIEVELRKKALPGPSQVEVGTMANEHSQPHYNITVAAPGVCASDITVTVDESTATCIGATARTGSSIDRRFRLPFDADTTLASATHIDGMLTLTIPKKAPGVPRELELLVGGVAEAQARHAAEVEDEEEGVMV